MESFPTFVVTQEAKESLLGIGVTGVTFDDVELTVTDQFEDLCAGRTLPVFAWLKPEGKPGRDDIGAAADGRLVLSQRALNTLSKFGTSNALVEPFKHDGVIQ